MSDVLEYRTIDKTAWGPGEWQDEPDKASWTDEATGLPCLAVRTHSGGHWCGYVAVNPGHPFYEKSYGDVYREGDWSGDNWPPAHGGLTYSNHCQDDEPEPVAVCHIPAPGEPDNVWWFGFDCAHGGDHSPGYASSYPGLDYGGLNHGSYKSLSYVRSYCEELAMWLWTVEKESHANG